MGIGSNVPAELVLDTRAELAEGPVWDDRRGVLWWVDIIGGRIHRFEPGTGSDVATEMGSMVGCVALTEQGSLVVALVDELLWLDPETNERAAIARFDDGPEAGGPAKDGAGRRYRSNDGKVDHAGGFWVGRLALDRAPGTSMLDRFDGARFEPVLRGLTIPNGLDWSLDGRTMYFTDSTERLVWAMDFDPRRRTPGSRRVIWRTSDVPALPPGAVPDGLTVDADDRLWLAIWGGGCVLRLTPRGKVEGRVDVPVSRVSSCAFGGSNMNELFITTAREGATEAEVAAEPTAGGIYRAKPGVEGRPPRRMRDDDGGERSAS